MINKPFCIKAVLFDFDGTLTQPGALNFPLLKETIGCPADIPVLEFIENLPASRMREEVEAVLAEGLAVSGPVIMEFIVEKEEGVYPMVPAGAAITEMLLV